MAADESHQVVAVVKAEATDRDTLCTLLRSIGVTVTEYDSAESYLAESTSPGCLITDLELPGMSGFELLCRLRSEDQLLPVIVLGEPADVSAAVAVIRAGACDFVERPHIDLVVPRRVAQLLGTASRWLPTV